MQVSSRQAIRGLSEKQRAALSRMQKLSWLLDRSLRIPGTRWRFGLDGLIGLVPGFGDAVSTLLSLVIFWQSYALHLPFKTRSRMLGNVLLDMVLGLVPVLGDIADVAFRANRRNLALIIEELEQQAVTVAPPRWHRWAGLLAVLLVAGALSGFFAVRWLAGGR